MRIVNITNAFSEDYVLEFAKELHSNYRAAFKALHTREINLCTIRGEHDHGWQGCHRKDYFIRRAKHVLKSRETQATVPF